MRLQKNSLMEKYPLKSLCGACFCIFSLFLVLSYGCNGKKDSSESGQANRLGTIVDTVPDPTTGGVGQILSNSSGQGYTMRIKTVPSGSSAHIGDTVNFCYTASNCTNCSTTTTVGNCYNISYETSYTPPYCIGSVLDNCPN